MKSLQLLTYIICLFIALTSCGGGDSEPSSVPTKPAPTTVAVTGVSISKTTLTLAEGESETLTASVAPSNASNKKISWSSNMPSVASVDDNGKVIAIAVGTATITVTTADGSKTAICTITVKDNYHQGNANHEGFN